MYSDKILFKIIMQMKNKNIKILIGAQSWAYGPAGKASAICHELKKQGVLVDFAGTTTSFNFCKNTTRFNQLFRINSYKDYLKLNISEYNAIISVMDPYLAFLAHKSKIPIFYADSMSCFWIWENAKETANKFKKADQLDLKHSLEQINKLEPDDRQLAGHLASDFIFTQGTPQYISKTKSKVKNVGSIIDLSFVNKRKRDTVLVSLSGGISPVTNLDSAVKYAEMIIDIISDDIKKISPSKRFILTGHPNVIEKIKKERSIFKFVAMNHQQFLKELNRAIVVLVPCGFTTIFESLKSKTPIIFLPDNHNGHVYEYLIISKKIKKDRERIFPNLLFTLDNSDLSNIRHIDDSMKIIRHFTEIYFKDINFRKKYKQKFIKIINGFNENKNLVDLQIKAVEHFIPFFNGAKIIADKILFNIKKNEKYN